MSGTRPDPPDGPSRAVIPISAWIHIPAGPAYAPARTVVAAVDQIHGDGEMPHLPVRRTRSRTDAGTYTWRPADGEPIVIGISAYSDHPHLTFAHELGHFVDQHAFGRLGRFASSTGRVPAIMRALASGQAVRHLLGLVGHQTIVVETRPGRRERHILSANLIGHLLRPEETFARAYAQYVAVSSGQQALLAELARERAAVLTGAVYHTQWSDEDFAAIREAFERTLAGKGWGR